MLEKTKLLKEKNFIIAKGKENNIDPFSSYCLKTRYAISKPCLVASSVQIYLQQNSILQIVWYICFPCPDPSIRYRTKIKLNPDLQRIT